MKIELSEKQLDIIIKALDHELVRAENAIIFNDKIHDKKPTPATKIINETLCDYKDACYNLLSELNYEKIVLIQKKIDFEV